MSPTVIDGLKSTDYGPLTISEIQDKVLLASGSMTAAVDRLEKLGLVVRKTSPRDRREPEIKISSVRSPGNGGTETRN